MNGRKNALKRESDKTLGMHRAVKTCKNTMSENQIKGKVKIKTITKKYWKNCSKCRS
jgi:hypothetical protein